MIKQVEARPEDEGEQVLVEMAVTEEIEEVPEEEPQKFEEQELEEVVKDDLLNTQKVTEVLIANDDEVGGRLQITG